MAARRHQFQSFALTVPGLGAFLSREADALGLALISRAHDGRADLVRFASADDETLRRLRVAEDVFVDLGEMRIANSARATAAALPIDRVRRAVGARRRVRLVVRVRDETRFRRRDLRDALASRLSRFLAHDRDQHAAEIWVLQTGRHTLRVGLRLARVSRPRAVELPGALRPAAAAAMLQLVTQRGLLVDPCCGTGTIALAALAALGPTISGDLDPRARNAARANGVRDVIALDAQHLPLRSGCAAATVTNLPFGRQHVVQGSPVAWYRRVLSEALRVGPQAVVLAAPTTPFRQALGRLDVSVDRYDLTMLGNRTAIWDLRRL